jgi:hypothetical protein
MMQMKVRISPARENAIAHDDITCNEVVRRLYRPITRPVKAMGNPQMGKKAAKTLMKPNIRPVSRRFL